MGDPINKLPTDTKSSINKSDMTIISNLFKNDSVNNSNNSNNSPPNDKEEASPFKDSVLGGVLFVVLSLPIVDKAIKSFLSHNDFIILGIKFLLFVILFFIMKKRS